MITPRHGSNTAKVGIKHQSINLSISIATTSNVDHLPVYALS
jgi:hypothetical protein